MDISAETGVHQSAPLTEVASSLAARLQWVKQKLSQQGSSLIWLGLALTIGAVAAYNAFASYQTNKQASQDSNGIQLNNSQVQASQSAAVVTTTPQPATLKVDVSGAVAHPGVKELPDSARVEDALQAAGGMTDKADAVYVAQAINLAQKIQDGDKIFIPTVGQALAATTSSPGENNQNSTTSKSNQVGQNSAKSNTKISINRSSQSDLESLPGIGETYAKRIIDNRPYSSIDDLCNRKLFRSQSTCSDIRSLVVL